MTQAWKLPFAVPRELERQAREIRGVVFAVDGVFSDGWLRGVGDGYLPVNALDRFGLRLLRKSGIEVGIVADAAPRPGAMTDLDIKYLRADDDGKLSALRQFLEATGLRPDQICCIGYDLEDLPLMLHSALAVAAAGANHVVKKSAHWITPSNGGSGSVREVCELILFAHEKLDACIDEYMRFDDALGEDDPSP